MHTQLPGNVRRLSIAPDRKALTLLETLLAMAMVTILAGVLAGLAAAVEQSSKHTHGVATATQHARVVLDRIGQLVRGAMAAERYPGAVVVYESSGGRRYADTLVIWSPQGTPLYPAAPPLARELVLICPHPDAPHQLVEIRVPSDMRPVEINDWLNTSAGRSFVDSLKRSGGREIVVLTDLLHTVTVSGTERAGVFFSSMTAPSASEFTAIRNGTLNWNDASWPAGLYSHNSGTCQTTIGMELQLRPSATTAGQGDAQRPLGFWGSAVVQYVVTR